MKHEKYTAVPEQEMQGEGVKDVTMRVLIGPKDGAGNFAMRRFRVRAGGHTPLHKHVWEHEIFVVAGAGSAVGEAGAKPMSPGDFIYVAPNEQHQFRNTGQDDLEFLCLIPSSYQT